MGSKLAKIYDPSLYREALGSIDNYLYNLEPQKLQRIGKPIDGDYVLSVADQFIDQAPRSRMGIHLPDNGTSPAVGKLPWHPSVGLWNQVGGNWQYAPVDDRLNNEAKNSALVDYFSRMEKGSNIYAPPFKASLVNW